MYKEIQESTDTPWVGSFPSDFISIGARVICIFCAILHVPPLETHESKSKPTTTLHLSENRVLLAVHYSLLNYIESSDCNSQGAAIKQK